MPTSANVPLFRDKLRRRPKPTITGDRNAAVPCAGSGRQLPEVHARPRPRRRPVPAADSGERASAGDSYLPETRRRRRGVRVPAGVGLRVTETAARRRRPLPTAGAEVPLSAAAAHRRRFRRLARAARPAGAPTCGSPTTGRVERAVLPRGVDWPVPAGSIRRAGGSAYRRRRHRL